LLDFGNATKWKDNLLDRVKAQRTLTLMQLVYGQAKETTSQQVKVHTDSDEESDDELFKLKKQHMKVNMRFINKMFFL
jgi:hypothetical protein